MLGRTLGALAITLPALAGSLIPRAPTRTCGTSISEKRIIDAEKYFAAKKIASSLSTSKKAAPIQVRFTLFPFPLS